MNEQSREHSPAHAWDLIKKIRTAMLVTREGESLDARPLQAFPDEAAGEIVFMTDSKRLLAQIEADGGVLLTFTNPSGNDYVCVIGQATVSNDRNKIQDLWTVWAKAFWKGPEDPNIRVITVVPRHARYWDSPNTVVTTMAMLASAVSGKQPNLGTSGETPL